MIRTLRIKFWERTALNAFTLSKFEKAQRAFEKILQLDPDRKGVYFNRGLALMSMQRFAEARQSFLEETSRHGDSLPLQKALAEVAYRMGDRIAARDHYSCASNLTSTAKEQGFCAKRAAICANEGQFAQAMAAQGLLDQADGLMLQKQFDHAEPLFQEACRLDPTCFQALNNIGAIRLSQKDYAGAKESFLKADELVDLPMVKNNLLYLAKRGFV